MQDGYLSIYVTLVYCNERCNLETHKMKDLIYIINTLFNLHTQIKFTVTTLDRVFENKEYINNLKFNSEFFDNQIPFQTSINTVISNHCIILFWSFLEEYENFNPAKFDIDLQKRILQVRKLNKPGLDRIKKWKDLKDFRNHLVAHSFKIKGKSFFSDEIKNLEYKIPNTISEKLLFLLITELICLNIRDEFPEVFLSIDPKSKMIDKFKIIGEEINVNDEGNKILSQMR